MDANLIAQTEAIIAKYGSQRIGISGSRTWVRDDIIATALFALPLDTCIITGGCIGADAIAARIAHHRGLYVVTILPSERRLVDPHYAEWANWVEDIPRSYKERNARIVALSTLLCAFPEYPESDDRATRSGTWQTIRMARKAHRVPPIIELPDRSI